MVNTYDPTTLHLTQTISNYGITGKEITTTYSDFDKFGHAKTQTVSAPDAPGEVTSIGYDPTGRFITSSTNWLGTETYTYNEVTGQPYTKTDVYGNTTTYDADLFGNYSSVISPDGITQTTTTNWANGNGPSGALYYTRVSTTGASDVVVWFDAEGRKMKEETTGFNNLQLQNTYTYNSNNGLLKKTEMSSGSVTKTTDYTYDESLRLSAVNSSDGNAVSYSYNSDWSVYETKNGVTTQKEFQL